MELQELALTEEEQKGKSKEEKVALVEKKTRKGILKGFQREIRALQIRDRG